MAGAGSTLPADGRRPWRIFGFAAIQSLRDGIPWRAARGCSPTEWMLEDMLRRQLALWIVCLAVISGCRTPMSTVSRTDSLADRPLQPVAQTAEPADVVPAIEQTAVSEDDSPSTAARLWNRIRPDRRISLPRTDFWNDEDGSEVLEPVDGFDTGF